MKVIELIAELAKYDDDDVVMIHNFDTNEDQSIEDVSYEMQYVVINPHDGD